MTEQPKIVILEDEDQERESLRDALELRDFLVLEFDSIPSIRKALDRLTDISVAVLDMELDAQGPAITGAQFGLEWKSRGDHVPRFLVLSGFETTEYYRTALDLGVARYLIKGQNQRDEVICHIRVLVLCHAVENDQIAVWQKLARIADGSTGKQMALDRYCCEILLADLAGYFDNPVFVYRSEGSEQRVLSLQPDAFDHQEISGRISRLLIEEGRPSQALCPGTDGQQDAALIKLFDDEEACVFLGILDSERNEAHPFPDDASLLANALTTHARTSLMGQIGQLVRMVEAAQSRRRGLLQATGTLCRNISRHLLGAMETIIQARSRGDEGTVDDGILETRNMAGEMREVGEVLDMISDTKANGGVTHSAAVLIRETWKDNTGSQATEAKLQIEGDFRIKGYRDQLDYAFSKILAWMAEQEDRANIRVFCNKGPTEALISFEDQSQRLGPKVRKLLFEPASLSFDPAIRSDSQTGLFLAQALLEHNGASLVDSSDERHDETGHRFVVTVNQTNDEAR